MGEYDDRLSATIAEHLRMSRQSNCRVWFTSWFGIGDSTDLTTIRILRHEDLHDQKIAVHYETYNRVRKRDSDNIFADETHYFTLDGDADVNGDGVANDMRHLCANYFTRPNYYRIDGRPVIVVYLSRVLNDIVPGLQEEAGGDLVWGRSELLAAVVNEMRGSTMHYCGLDPYIIGDHAFGSYRSTRDPAALELLDAITK
jgi:hypothetical protein